jgi:hypothetical protein
LQLRAKSEAAARQGKKNVFHFYFPEIFQINSIHSSKIPFMQENDFFLKIAQK